MRVPALFFLLASLCSGCVQQPPDVRITGTVSDISGAPVPDCRVIVLHPGFDSLLEAECDESGRYELVLPQGLYNAIAIADDGYGKETLEFWAWNVIAEHDREVDVTIDRLEVYNLSVWNSKGGPKSFFLSFRPMALDRYLASPSTFDQVVGPDTLQIYDIAPALHRDHIEVLLDGIPVEIESVQWYYERYFDAQVQEHRAMRVCLLQVQRPELAAGLHEVRVRITDVASGAVGEAITDFESNESGLGF